MSYVVKLFLFAMYLRHANCLILNLRRVSNGRLARSLSSYEHNAIESKWQSYWEKNKVFKAPRVPGPKKKYVLDMFPYPSGAGLHVGHPEGYTATDIMSRYWRMIGYDVLHPMGWDAFGLPAEQHAIATGTHPAVTTDINISTFKRQLKALGFSYDWDREISTTDNSYVRWTQWIFLQLFKRGLAYQSNIHVNWCPMLGTVLANEEIIDGKSERGGHPVVRMPIRQWVLKITDYADRLLDDLSKIEWPEGTLVAQKQWIGKSSGFLLNFKVPDSNEMVQVYTTRLETLCGVTHIVLAPEHRLVSLLTTSDNVNAVKEYQHSVAQRSDLERTVGKSKLGVHLGGVVIHPYTHERIPVWIADYVLASFGTGAVMAVPAHDERDFEFAQHNHIPFKPVISASLNLPYCGEGVLINSGNLDGLHSQQVRDILMKHFEEKGCGTRREMYKLRDWIFSRQRYWGEPIPIYFPVEIADPSTHPSKQPYSILYDQPLPVEEKELPIKLPAMDDFQPGNDPAGCLARENDWRFFKKDGKWYARETNTMPQWAGSCWYYLRFIDPRNEAGIFAEETARWLPVDLYVGGQEHAVLHLLYARFWHKFLHDIKVVNHEEPFLKLVHQGMILGSDGEKMSKSRGNVINPDDIIRDFGADALRLYEMFMGPLEAMKPWQTSQLMGVVRFRDKIYNLCQRPLGASSEKHVISESHRTIKKVTNDIEKMAFNTAISALMTYCNFLCGLSDPLPKEAVKILLLLTSPFAPHLSEECWGIIGEKGCIAQANWPSFDESKCMMDVITVAVQINGKLRGKIEVGFEESRKEELILERAMELSSVQKHIGNSRVQRHIYVKGKIINIII